jgi:hypothetical protein
MMFSRDFLLIVAMAFFALPITTGAQPIATGTGVKTPKGIVLPLPALLKAHPIKDLAQYKAEQPAVLRIVSQGIISPIALGMFGPTVTVTRGDYAVMLQRLFALRPPTHVMVFPDVTRSDPRYAAIQAAGAYMNRQIFCFGCQLKEQFSPNQAITNGEAIVYLMRILGAKGLVKPLAPSDVSTIVKKQADAAMYAPLAAPLYAIAIKDNIAGIEPNNVSIQPVTKLNRVHAAVLLDQVQIVKKIPFRRYALPIK